MGIDAKEQNVMRVEAGIEAVKIAQSADEKSRADEDDDGKSDLRDDECIAETEAAARLPGGASREEALLSAMASSRRASREGRGRGRKEFRWRK